MTSRWVKAAVALLAGIAIIATPRPAAAGPGDAGRGSRTNSTVGPIPAGAEYMVLVWYRGDDALGTFEHQTYDVRKGEYSETVTDWIRMMRAKYPRYVVRVLPVDLDRERGATEMLKVGSVIRSELLLAAAQSGVVLGAPMRIGPGPYATQRSLSRPSIRPGAGGSSHLNPPGASMPFPIPYPRPHP